MKLIVITTENFFESEAEAIDQLFENGLSLLHIRKPRASYDETESFIKQIKTDFRPRVVLHDYNDLAELYGLKGIHLNLRNQANRDKVHFKLSISRSCHSLEDVAESQTCDYVFLSPVFDSISKAGYKQAFTPQQLEEAKQRKAINKKVIALGGIKTENIPVVRQYGFGGVAVLGALWRDFIVDRNVDELLKRFNALKNTL